MDDDADPPAGAPALLIDVHVGQRLRSALSDKGLSREAVAEALGVSLQQLAGFEHGTIRVGGARLLRLANLFSVPLTFFFEGLESGETSYPPQP
ncbi:MAG: helix-turn-helix transcriptional regulator [Acidisphaera sp.]|nr:helix-turn-helix transcriptional regulator [Acidisphaera sp.]